MNELCEVNVIGLEYHPHKGKKTHIWSKIETSSACSELSIIGNRYESDGVRKSNQCVANARSGMEEVGSDDSER